MDEKWLPVKGYEGFYEVSNMGRIKSLDRYIKRKNSDTSEFRRGVILKHKLNIGGYFINGISKDGQGSTVYLHKVVATAFVENPNGYPEANHIDGDKGNNRASNLEWTTPQLNTIHAYENGLTQRTSDKCKSSKLTFDQADEIRMRYFNNKELMSTLAMEYGVAEGVVYSVVIGDSYQRKELYPNSVRCADIDPDQIKAVRLSLRQGLSMKIKETKKLRGKRAYLHCVKCKKTSDERGDANPNVYRNIATIGRRGVRVRCQCGNCGYIYETQSKLSKDTYATVKRIDKPENV